MHLILTSRGAALEWASAFGAGVGGGPGVGAGLMFRQSSGWSVIGRRSPLRWSVQRAVGSGGGGSLGLARGFDVGYSGRTLSKPDPKLLWARRPKSVPEPVAVKQLEKVAAVIAETVKAQVKDGKPASKKEAKKAVKELVAEMPGYDWHAHYQRAYTEAMDRAAKQQQAASTAAMLEQVSAYQLADADDEDAILLMLA